MQNKMLIDAGHPEETRVIVLRGNRVEEFDFEAASKKQLRGNIYLAKVTRVEPSLQAAFVEYGGNRHGFLAFSEIHPDYYQIPVADRQALLEEDARAERADEDDEGRTNSRRRGRRRQGEAAKRRPEETVSAADHGGEEHEESAGRTHAPTDTHHDAAAIDADDGPETHAHLAGGSSADTSDTSHDALHDAGEQHDPAPHQITAAVSTEAPHATTDQIADATDGTPETPTEPVADGSGLESDVVAAREGDAALAEALPDAPSAGGTAPVDDDAMHHAPVDDEGEERTVSLTDAGYANGGSGAREVRRQPGDDTAADDDEDDGNDDEEEDGEDQQVEQIGGDAMEEVPSRPHRPRRHYKIQEVIKRRQVLLVQVVKEERGTKGAALTTYLSLAGRYSVLMPNTARGGGISRKITDNADRKRLKSIAEDLEVPDGMGIILRTAGASRTKAEVKRDFEYLLRMWETVREVTLKSTAPTLVYEEGSLIKRAIRDLYSKDIEEILVAGDDGYREAKEFMRMLMPSHAKNVQPYREASPIFTHAGAEAQLDGMYHNQVTLRSGGYIVINQTEALVAIDVNSGRSTREHNIEDTALRTNLEAADEVARQLRLRDLAGLIVVDFIDMEEGRNNRAVERRMKDALKNDRARIQIGRISHFGLLEMSRQRIRTGVLEGSTIPCPHCMGAGMVRSTSSIALHVLRGLEDALIKNPSFNILVKTRTEVALYILNQKRSHLRDIEARFGVTITVTADTSLSGIAYYTLERGELATPQIDLKPRHDLVQIDTVQPIFDDETADVEDEEIEADGEEDVGETVEADSALAAADGDDRSPDADGRRRRRRRRRRGGRDREREGQDAVSFDAPQPSDDALAAVVEIAGETPRESPRARNGAVSGDEPAHLAEPGEDAADAEDAGEHAAHAEGATDPARPASRRRRRSRRGEPRRLSQRDPEASPVEVSPVEPSDEPLQEATVHGDGPAVNGAGYSEHGGDAPTEFQSVDTAVESYRPTPRSDDIDGPPARAALSDAGGDAIAVVAPVALEPEDAPASAQVNKHVDEEHAGANAADHANHADVAPAQAEPARLEPPAADPAVDDPSRPKRSGWWQRAKATFGG